MYGFLGLKPEKRTSCVTVKLNKRIYSSKKKIKKISQDLQTLILSLRKLSGKLIEFKYKDDVTDDSQEYVSITIKEDTFQMSAHNFGKSLEKQLGIDELGSFSF